MVNLEQSVNQISEAWYVVLTFSLTVTFYPTKTENRKLKNLQQSSHAIALSKGTIFAKKMLLICQKMLTSAELRRSWY